MIYSSHINKIFNLKFSYLFALHTGLISPKRTEGSIWKHPLNTQLDLRQEHQNFMILFLDSYCCCHFLTFLNIFIMLIFLKKIEHQKLTQTPESKSLIPCNGKFFHTRSNDFTYMPHYVLNGGHLIVDSKHHIGYKDR